MRILVLIFAMFLAVPALPAAPPQAAAKKKPAAGPKDKKPARAAAKRPAAPKSKLNAQQTFVLDVVQMAVALPQSDPQDRLRVLNSAMSVSAPVAPKVARKFSREAARIESELIAQGQVPAVSVMSNGQVDCATAAEFVEQLAPTAVGVAEQSLIGAVTTCPKRTADLARARVEAAMQQRIVPARAVLALIDHYGAKSAWAQQIFAELFRSLPTDEEISTREAPNFAAMFLQMAPQVDKPVARRAGLSFLEWLGKLPQGDERNLAVNMTTDSFRKLLGGEEYQEALASNVMARQAAETAGQPAELRHQEHESASVLGAMREVGKDQSEALSGLPASLRAREAAAHGFATGTSGDKPGASRYFDIAFAAVDEVWSNRSPQANAAAVVEEVSEAAAQVDAVAALTRAQGLHDPSAQAIGMLAVARVVLGKQAQ